MLRLPAELQGVFASPISSPDAAALFTELFSPQSLISVFTARLSRAESRGVDRTNGIQFSARAAGELEIVSRKCLSGTFKFSPYLENLKNKGRGKAPRLISIPTIRDRIVLHQLNKLLANVFPECVPRNVASSYIRAISNDLASKVPENTYVCGSDIKTFYDGIKHDRLVSLIEKRLEHKPAINLIKHALLTPTVPKNARRSEHKRYRPSKGVPQGLAISNILAALYLAEVDAAMKNLGIAYFRYVDDVLIYGDEIAVRKAHKSLGARLKLRGLALHSMKSDKSQIGPLNQVFGYLGYTFDWPKITVRDTTIERLLHSLAAKFSHHIHTKEARLRAVKYLTTERLSEIFLLELNEKITGAISGSRRYGWIAYFSQINDLNLLHRLDAVVAQMFRRLTAFDSKPPIGLKTFIRSYYEMKFNPAGGYVRNFDQITSRAERLQFLAERGLVGPEEALSDEEINSRFDAYLKLVLSQMNADEGRMYG